MGLPESYDLGLPWELGWYRIHLQCRIPGFNPWVGKICWRRDLKAFQYSWASLVAQLVKNPPAMWEICVRSLVGKIPWKREWPPTPVFWPGEFHGLYSPWVPKCRNRLSDFHFPLTLGPLPAPHASFPQQGNRGMPPVPEPPTWALCEDSLQTVSQGVTKSQLDTKRQRCRAENGSRNLSSRKGEGRKQAEPAPGTTTPTEGPAVLQVPGPNPHEVVSGKQWKGHPSGGEHPCSAFAGTCLMPRAQSRSGVARKPHESTGQGRELQGEALPSCCVRTCCCC